MSGRRIEMKFAGGGSASGDWRIICACQTHNRQGFVGAIIHSFGRSTKPILKLCATLIASAPFVVGAIELPIDKAATPVRPIEIKAPKVVPMSLAPPLGELSVGPNRVAKSFRLVTPRIRSSFLEPAYQIDELTLELIRSDYFNREIPYGEIIYREAKAHGLSPELVAAVVKTESDFRPRLISNKNALGLMQIIPSTGRLMGATDLMNPEENIRIGARYLQYLQGRLRGGKDILLAAYNAGEGNVARFRGIPPFAETHEYLRRVARAKLHYQSEIERKIAEFNSSAVAEAEETPVEPLPIAQSLTSAIIPANPD